MNRAAGKIVATGCAMLFTVPTGAQTPQPALALTDQIAVILATPAIARDHWGIAVTALDGTPIYSLNDAQLFHPASNAKLFTTAAALALLGPNATVETTARVSGIFTGKEYVKGDVHLYGDGDANLSGRAIPYTPDSDEAFPPLRYLDEFATEIAQTGLKTVDGDVIASGRGTYQPYPEGWNADDLVWGYGAPVSLLSINDNQLKLRVTPATELSSRAILEVTPAVPYYTVVNDVMTVGPREPVGIQIERTPASKTLRVYGRIALHAAPESDHISIDDPEEFAAIALRQLLQQHGVNVTGKAIGTHLPSDDPRSFREISHQPMDFARYEGLVQGKSIGDCFANCDQRVRAIDLPPHISPTLLQDVVVTNKSSLNLHAELLLRRLGARYPPFGVQFNTFNDTFADGARVVRQWLINAGIDPSDFIFYDGSGLSTKDLVTPRAIAKLLSYAVSDPKTHQPQPWFAVWKSSLPIGGVDGSLEKRFTKPPLNGHVFAKTGTIGEARALSGYLDCGSGRTVIFSILVDNHLPGTSEDRDAMDRIVAAIQAAE